MPRKRSGFEAAIAIGRTLPDVEVTTTWGAPALKVRGKMFACVAINKSAEPDSMVVRMDTAQRDLLIEEEPATYTRRITTSTIRACSSDYRASRRRR